MSHTCPLSLDGLEGEGEGVMCVREGEGVVCARGEGEDEGGDVCKRRGGACADHI